MSSAASTWCLEDRTTTYPGAHGIVYSENMIYPEFLCLHHMFMDSFALRDLEDSPFCQTDGKKKILLYNGAV